MSSRSSPVCTHIFSLPTFLDARIPVSSSSFRYTDAVWRFAIFASTTYSIFDYGWTKISWKDPAIRRLGVILHGTAESSLHEEHACRSDPTASQWYCDENGMGAWSWHPELVGA